MSSKTKVSSWKYLPNLILYYSILHFSWYFRVGWDLEVPFKTRVIPRVVQALVYLIFWPYHSTKIIKPFRFRPCVNIWTFPVIISTSPSRQRTLPNLYVYCAIEILFTEYYCLPLQRPLSAKYVRNVTDSINKRYMSS